MRVEYLCVVIADHGAGIFGTRSMQKNVAHVVGGMVLYTGREHYLWCCNFDGACAAAISKITVSISNVRGWIK